MQRQGSKNSLYCGLYVQLLPLTIVTTVVVVRRWVVCGVNVNTHTDSMHELPGMDAD
jgi:hypothetical protein